MTYPRKVSWADRASDETVQGLQSTQPPLLSAATIKLMIRLSEYDPKRYQKIRSSMTDKERMGLKLAMRAHLKEDARKGPDYA